MQLIPMGEYKHDQTNIKKTETQLGWVSLFKNFTFENW